VKTSTKFLASALVFAALTSPALADSSSFPYVAIDIGQTKAKDACSTAGLPAGSTVSGCKDSAGTLRVALGTEFASQFSGEISYASYGSASMGTLSVPGFAPLAGGNWKLSGFQLAGIGAFPLTDVVALTGKIGLASTKITLDIASMSATSTNLMFGVGLQFKVNRDVAIRAQYENLGTVGDANTTGTAKVSLMSVGMVYKF
jgi:opacity protein-like surface antigen